MYRGTLVPVIADPKLLIERVQTGVRMEKRILKVLKGFAEYHDMTLGRRAGGHCPCTLLMARLHSAPHRSTRIRELKKFYGLDLDSNASHRLTEIKKGQTRMMAREKKKMTRVHAGRDELKCHDNEEIIEEFEHSRAPDGSFHHADHIRVAFAYLSQYPVLEALRNFATLYSALPLFRAIRGLYHETIHGLTCF